MSDCSIAIALLHKSILTQFSERRQHWVAPSRLGILPRARPDPLSAGQIRERMARSHQLEVIFMKKITNIIHSTFVVVALGCFALSPRAQAVNPPPDGGYPNFTTAKGTSALQNLTTGSANTAVGWFSLFSDTDGSFNTATGAGALLFNTGNNNTANGAAALLFNSDGEDNTAVGAAALSRNTTGNNNIAVGASAGADLTTGENNIDIGNRGIAGESDTIRIGDPAIHAATFIAGINGVTLSEPTSTVVVDAHGQLGRINVGLTSVLYNYSNAPTFCQAPGVGFPDPPLVVGAAISKSDDCTFVLNQDGVYRVTYTVAAPTSMHAQVEVNGTLVGPRLENDGGSHPINDQVTFAAIAGSTVHLRADTGGGPFPNVASINIDRLQ